MTPTEQDNELRDKVATIVEYWDFSPLQDEDSRIERLKNEIMQLITADRKRVALEAELEALQFAKQSASDNFTFSGWEDDINRRIAELKAQQENLLKALEEV